jgi:hypothetical protein
LARSTRSSRCSWMEARTEEGKGSVPCLEFFAVRVVHHAPLAVDAHGGAAPVRVADLDS